MEKLRSTEALDREILEDARKKADRALKNADQAAKAVEIEWEQKWEADAASFQLKHERRVAAKREEINARLPLDKRRIRAERAERLLRSAMDKTLRSLPRDRVLALLERDFSKRAAELGSAALTVHARGLSDAELSALLSHALPGSAWTLSDRSAIPMEGSLPAVVAEGGGTTVRVGLAEAGEEFLREKRAEAAAALLGSEAFDD